MDCTCDFSVVGVLRLEERGVVRLIVPGSYTLVRANDEVQVVAREKARRDVRAEGNTRTCVIEGEREREREKEIRDEFTVIKIYIF